MLRKCYKMLRNEKCGFSYGKRSKKATKMLRNKMWQTIVTILLRKICGKIITNYIIVTIVTNLQKKNYCNGFATNISWLS